MYARIYYSVVIQSISGICKHQYFSCVMVYDCNAIPRDSSIAVELMRHHTSLELDSQQYVIQDYKMETKKVNSFIENVNAFE